ncbi:HSP90 family protein [Phycicoccus flavus]|uniref:HSP90 family protein n=1 Tax=Phycicoccus flavus TaxID=2502783 RepID=A0A8T6R183_9MICO|nr:ATP-binding protein [Phycicoccus flavus]NHA67717.1 hypothetical protein [Phycicoccus flavus]
MVDSSGDAGPQQFQVDLRGIVDVLSHHLYSSPRVYLRELLQNAVDALEVRSRLDEGPGRGIRVTPATPFSPLVVRDDGVGLTADEMHALLATIGGTSKRGDFAGARRQLLGQFGIGLLSCFLVADTVEVRSRSARTEDADTILWVGRSEGTFSISVADEPLDSPGTEIRVYPRADDLDWCTAERTHELAAAFAEHLPITVEVDGTVVSGVTPPWDLPLEEQLEWCRERMGFDPLGIVPLDSSLGGVRGVGFVLPYTAMPGHRTGDRLYSKGMLVADSDNHVLPGWAFFCRAVIDGGDLPLTASRESFQESEALAVARERLGHVLIGELILVQAMHPHAYEEVMRLHAGGLKALALKSADMLDLLRSTMPFRTTLGDRTLDGLHAVGEEVRYVTDASVYAALEELARHSGTLVLDASGPYDAGLVAAFDPEGRLFREVTSADAADIAEVGAAPDAAAAERLVARASSALPEGVTLGVADVSPADRPVLWWPHEGVDGEPTGTRSTLLLNARHDAVRALLDASDDLDVGAAVRALHGVGMLLARVPLDGTALTRHADAVATLVRDGIDCHSRASS